MAQEKHSEERPPLTVTLAVQDLRACGFPGYGSNMSLLSNVDDTIQRVKCEFHGLHSIFYVKGALQTTDNARGHKERQVACQLARGWLQGSSGLQLQYPLIVINFTSLLLLYSTKPEDVKMAHEFLSKAMTLLPIRLQARFSNYKVKSKYCAFWKRVDNAISAQYEGKWMHNDTICMIDALRRQSMKPSLQALKCFLDHPNQFDTHSLQVYAACVNGFLRYAAQAIGTIGKSIEEFGSKTACRALARIGAVPTNIHSDDPEVRQKARLVKAWGLGLKEARKKARAAEACGRAILLLLSKLDETFDKLAENVANPPKVLVGMLSVHAMTFIYRCFW